jgi:hypothetical protein
MQKNGMKVTKKLSEENFCVAIEDFALHNLKQ